jgi:hypothetical protein
MAATVDINQLFFSLLLIALLQEFAIKPSVEFIKRYYNKSKKHFEKLIKNNGKI